MNDKWNPEGMHFSDGIFCCGMQLGRYAEYYAKMEFTSYGFDVYTSEVDDHGVDFVAKPPLGTTYYEVQVKSSRDFGYVYIPKEKMQLTANRLVCYLHFIDGQLPDVYIIPSTAWLAPNAVPVDRKYEKEGQKSAPE
jgi:hypothetical protein